MTVALVAGAVANKPGNAGAAWTRLSWAIGLQRLGFDVHLVEELAPNAGPQAEAWFASVAREARLEGAATLLRTDGSTAYGLTLADLGDLASDAALLVNISGHLTRRELVERPGVRVLVDLDPGYTQLWHDSGVAPLVCHDHWYTVGSLVGTRHCRLPTGGLRWRPILQPVVLDLWPVQPPHVSEPRFTTIASWRGAFGPIEHDGRMLGAKVHEFRRFARLPLEAPGFFEIALDIHPADAKDRALLEEHGWYLRDPAEVAGDVDAFRRYIQGSGAEVSVAQAVYVHTSTGWLGDRTTRYLASGRPALVQDTGFSRCLPCGEGLMAFTTIDEAVAGAASILDDYERHARAARALAEERLDSRVVLRKLCEEVDVAP